MQQLPSSKALTAEQTRKFLAEMAKSPDLIDKLDNLCLDDAVVAEYACLATQRLYTIASFTKLKSVTRLLELAFYESIVAVDPIIAARFLPRKSYKRPASPVVQFAASVGA